MPEKRLRNTLLLTLLSLAFVVCAVSGATYAWFTANRTTSTDRITAKTSDSSIELQISKADGGKFVTDEAVEITQVNAGSAKELMPVSTSDLQTFVYSLSATENGVTGFGVVENEKYYYHGRVLLRTVSDEQNAGKRMALYFDNEDIVSVSEEEDSLLLNAARLGLTLDGSSPMIFSLSDEANEAQDRVYNTTINGENVGEGNVITLVSEAYTAVSDPAESYLNYTVPSGEFTAEHLKPVYYLELNRTYTLDIYFYIEGCDPDCSNSIFFDAADMKLDFYGIMVD